MAIAPESDSNGQQRFSPCLGVSYLGCCRLKKAQITARVSGRQHLRFADFHGQGDADGLSASVFGDDAIAARNFLNSVLSIATKRNGCKPIGADEQGLSSSAMASTDPMCVEKSSSTTAPELNGLST